jgi:hypothetical protein
MQKILSFALILSPFSFLLYNSFMPNLLPALLPRLESLRFQTLSLPASCLTPAYDGYSLLNIPSSICAWLGVPPIGAAPLAEEMRAAYPGPYRRVVMLIVDGLGLTRFLELSQDDPKAYPGLGMWQSLLPQSTLAAITSVSPSTTASALTTLWTGRSPAEHGVIGYELFLKEYGVIANMIKHNVASMNDEPGSLRRAGFHPETALGHPVLGNHLAAHGVQTHAFQHASIARSGLSTMLLQGANTIPFFNISDLWVSVSSLLQSPKEEQQFIYIYWGEIDELEHRYGPQDERVRREFDSFSLQLARFLHELKQTSNGDTLFIMTADHGQIATPRVQNYDLKNHPQLTSWLTLPPTGERRFAYLFVRPRCEARLLDYVENTWHGIFRLYSADQVRSAGLLGSGDPDPRLKDRMGDWVLIPLEDAYWWWSEKENNMLGRHGGLSSQEMLTPLLILAT